MEEWREVGKCWWQVEIGEDTGILKLELENGEFTYTLFVEGDPEATVRTQVDLTPEQAHGALLVEMYTVIER